jgi:hypothetical protein
MLDLLDFIGNRFFEVENCFLARRSRAKKQFSIKSIEVNSDLAPWAIVRSTIAHGVDFSEFQRRRATLKLAN